MKVKAVVRSSGKGLVSALLTLAACTTSRPTADFDARASRAGFESGEISGSGFRHRTFSAPGDAQAGILLVYFGGDGTPFLRRDIVARDPTPRRPVALDLMAQGPRPAVFLGRPCYHGLTERCHPSLWTVARFSEPVVASMTAALRRLAEDHPAENLVLVGYSGGGALALLVAERLELVDAVVTLAANLDTEAWVALHDYTPLVASLEPAMAAGTRQELLHLHATGGADANVPPSLHDRLRRRLPAEAFRVIPGFDHRCCWVEQWPRLAAEVEARLTENDSAPAPPAAGPSPAPDDSRESRRSP